MDLVILEKIESSILNGLGYIVRLEKKNGNNRINIKRLAHFGESFNVYSLTVFVFCTWY